MKIEVHIDDAWVEEGDVKEAIRSEIVHQTVQAIKKEYGEQFTKAVKEEAHKIVRDNFEENISSLSLEVIKEATIDGKSVKDYMKDQFENDRRYGWYNPKEAIKAEADNIATEMKRRYDMQFAALLINKLEKGGFLKEGVADLLLTDEKPKT